MPKLKPVDDSFFDLAPERYAETWSIPRPPEDVWAELVGERPLHWCRGLSTSWTSPRPFGVGTSRQAKVLGGAIKVQEHFFLWEEGHRYAFYGTEANVPVFASLAEDYIVEPDGAGRCRYTWRIAIAPTAVGRPGGRLNKLLFGSFFRDTGRYFDARGR